MIKFKRYCKTLQLENDAEFIEEYKKIHAMGNAWPEITQGMKDVGIIDMEIYLEGSALFMIIDKAMKKLASLPRQSEWEANVSKYQKASVSSSANEKWKLIERIYKLDQNSEHNAEDGYLEEIKIVNHINK